MADDSDDLEKLLARIDDEVEKARKIAAPPSDALMEQEELESKIQDRRIKDEKHQADMARLSEQALLRQKLVPVLIGATWITLCFTLVAIFLLFWIDLVALADCASGDCSKSVNDTKYTRIIDEKIVIALITASVAEVAAMAYAMVKWGFDGKKPPGST